MQYYKNVTTLYRNQGGLVMANYLVTFTPLEPYFFGNERVFTYGKVETAAYFIKSESIPSQSTVFGTIRYCCIPNPTIDFRYDSSIIGKQSFNIMEKEQDFGYIKSISPIFLIKGNEYFIVTPYNHNQDEEGEKYTPFKKYQFIETCEGSKCFPIDYKSKKGIADSFTSIVTGKIYNFIRTTDQVGIKKSDKENAFFKRRYGYLQEDGLDFGIIGRKNFNLSFAVMAEIEKLKLDGKKQIAYMGQGKTAFLVQFKECEDNFTGKVIKFWKEKNKYPLLHLALSDTYIEEPITKINEICYYVNVKLRDYRSFQTSYNSSSHTNRYKKGKYLQHMIKSGSVFWVKENCEKQFYQMINHSNCKKVGFNKVL